MQSPPPDDAASLLAGAQPAAALLRPEMVEAARKFMMTPKVRETPISEQRLFLLGKGVTDAEIAAARAGLSDYSSGPGPSSPSVMGQHHHQHGMAMNHPRHRFFDFANSIVLIGGMSYAGYRILRSWILPRFFDIPDPVEEANRQVLTQVLAVYLGVDILQMNEMQNAMKFVLDSVQQTLQTVNTQQEQLNRLVMMSSRSDGSDSQLHRLEAEIGTVKSLLLNQNQFPAAPVNQRHMVPAWQQQPKPEVKSAATNGYVTPPSTLAVDSMVSSNDDTEVERTMNQAHVNGNILNGDGDH